MVVVGKVLVVGGIILVGYGIYSFSCRLRRHFYTLENDEEKVEDPREPLLPDNYQTVKRPKVKHVPSNNAEDEIENSSISQEAAGGHGDGDSDWAVTVLDGSSLSSNLSLEVISGPSVGARISQQTQGSGVSLTIGRIPQNDLVLNDLEVSGKHALITWNPKVFKWELIDMGSLNGTLLNMRSVAATHSSAAHARQRGNAVSLSHGDIVTLGSTSQVQVQITSGKELSHLAVSSVPFGIGVATDPMSVHRGGKSLPMEDVCLCEWPLRGFQEIGVFCIFDGHGGAAAAEAASRIVPEKMAQILSAEERRMELLSQCDASEVLRDTFRETENALDKHEYEGCTATVLVLWANGSKGFYAQCANVGDSACVFSIRDQHVVVTEDHRLTSYSERARLLEMGKQLKDGENRICGMNIARALGDKFLKEQDGCFSSEPYVSEVLRIEPDSRAIALIASDGMWDVFSPRRAIQVALDARKGLIEGQRDYPRTAQGIAEMLLSTAKSRRTKDNTSIIVLDFMCNSTHSFRTL